MFNTFHCYIWNVNITADVKKYKANNKLRKKSIGKMLPINTDINCQNRNPKDVQNTFVGQYISGWMHAHPRFLLPDLTLQSTKHFSIQGFKARVIEKLYASDLYTFFLFFIQWLVLIIIYGTIAMIINHKRSRIIK